MTRRTQHVATGFEEIVAAAVEQTRRAGAKSFELEYDAADRRLRPDEEPLPDEAVRWSATATFPGRFGDLEDRIVTGTAVARPGECGHNRAISYAVVRMLEAAGANTVVVDTCDHTMEPPR
ncbi:hypothetical protein [Nocardioides sp. LHG3406-4]|uniref:hypothetical protein n=1 Tax=Nocardioides sp. LHG3406-4 TaxID=2804575 RepID=UPI003CE97EFE